jgi:hypothetical protein
MGCGKTQQKQRKRRGREDLLAPLVVTAFQNKMFGESGLTPAGNLADLIPKP